MEILKTIQFLEYFKQLISILEIQLGILTSFGAKNS